jgi:hypothetical protein
VSGPPRQEIQRRDTTPLMQRDPLGLAHHFANSGFFKDACDVSKAVVKVVFGEELGIGPGASMQGVHIIEGKPSLSANLLGTLVKRSGRYDYRPQKVDDAEAAVAFFENGEEVGVSTFTLEQAKAAGLVRAKSGWERFPQAMLFARALSQGVRWYCPDVTAGSPAYTPEELGAEVDQSGEPVYVESEVEVSEAATPTLGSEKITQLEQGIAAAEGELAKSGVNWLDGLNVLLGSLGIDGFSPSIPLAEELAKLAPEQADAIKAELGKLADAATEKEGDDAGN